MYIGQPSRSIQIRARPHSEFASPDNPNRVSPTPRTAKPASSADSAPRRQYHPFTVAEHGPILFFDGACDFCNASVRWVERHDRRRSLRFAPLQGATYASLDIPHKPRDLSSLVLVDRARLFVRSAATVRMLRLMGGVWWALGWTLWLVPLPLRDAAYRHIARRRHRLMAPQPTGAACAAPSEGLRARMLP